MIETDLTGEQSCSEFSGHAKMGLLNLNPSDRNLRRYFFALNSRVQMSLTSSDEPGGRYKTFIPRKWLWSCCFFGLLIRCFQRENPFKYALHLRPKKNSRPFLEIIT